MKKEIKKVKREKVILFIAILVCSILFFGMTSKISANDIYPDTCKITESDMIEQSNRKIYTIQNIYKENADKGILNVATLDNLENINELLVSAKIEEKLREEIIYAKEGNKETPEEEHARITSELRNSIVAEVCSWVGVTPYVSAGRSLSTGTDCSGFTNLIYGIYGIQLPTGSDAYQSNVGRHVSYDELLPGDIIVYRYGGHVAIYIGDNTIIHCANPSTGTVVASMYNETPTAYVRVIE